MRAVLAGAILVMAACGSSQSPTTKPEESKPWPTPSMTAEPTPTEPSAKPTPNTEPALPDPDRVKADLLAAESAAFASAKPVFDKYCAKCHTKDGKNASAKKLDHFDMTTYPFGGHHAAEIGATIRTVLAIDGGKPTMPADKKGAVKGDELALIKAWSDAFDASHAGGAHENMPDHGRHH